MSRAIETGSRARAPSPAQASRAVRGGKQPTGVLNPDRNTIAVKAIA